MKIKRVSVQVATHILPERGGLIVLVRDYGRMSQRSFSKSELFNRIKDTWGHLYKDIRYRVLLDEWNEEKGEFINAEEESIIQKAEVERFDIEYLNLYP